MVAFGCVLAMTVFAGCGFGPSLYPVTGQVTLDGKPLPSGNVVFWPDKNKGNTSTVQPTGQVQDGKFVVKTQGSDGAPVGWYSVTVTSTEKIDSTKPLEVKNPIDDRFREAANTTLKVEVVAAPTTNAYDLKVTSKQP